MRKAVLHFLIVIATTLLAVEPVPASDASLHCSLMPYGMPMIKYCLANTGRLKPDEAFEVYFDVSGAYFELGNIDEAIEFGLKAAQAGDLERPPERNHEPYPGGLTYNQMLMYFHNSRSLVYERLAGLEELKSLRLEIKNSDLNDAVPFAANALLHATKAVVINPSNHEAYATRARIEARFCKNDEARTDAQEAIDLATRAGDKEDAADYELIDVDTCSEDHRGRLN